LKASYAAEAAQEVFSILFCEKMQKNRARCIKQSCEMYKTIVRKTVNDHKKTANDRKKTAKGISQR